jgi:hypothetical protein
MRLLAKPESKSNEYMMILAQIMKKNYIKTFLAQLMPLSAQPHSKTQNQTVDL